MNQFIDSGISLLEEIDQLFFRYQIDNGFNKPFKIESIPYESN